MLRTFSIPISWGELFKRTIREARQDDCFGLAAQLAYYLLLALAPAMAVVIALASYIPTDLVGRMMSAASAVMPQEIVAILQSQLREIAGGHHGGVLTFGILLALWSSSAAMVAVTSALNRAYDIEESRPWWKVRLAAIGLTIALAVMLVLAFALVVAGPLLGRALANAVGLGEEFSRVWPFLQWPLALVLITLAIGLVNYVAPDAEQDWEWITPGALLATVLWLTASLAFKVYVSRFGDYNATYGSLAGIVVLMLWLYLSALAILVGAEMNAEIEHASPHGKEPGEKAKGQRRKLGAAAARAFAASGDGGGGQTDDRGTTVTMPPGWPRPAR